MAASLRFAPEFQVRLNDQQAPAALRACTSAVNFRTGLDGVDRVELTLVNDNLRWLDHPLLALDTPLALSIGYAPDALTHVFVGEITGHEASFPAGDGPSLTVIAQDRRNRLQRAVKSRWFAVPVSCSGNWPLPDLAVAGAVALEHQLVPIFDPIGAALSLILGGVEVVVAYGDAKAVERLIRKQVGETDFEFLRRIAHENGWEVVSDPSDPLGGRKLHFLSLADHLAPDLVLRYGQSLVEFAPRISSVGQVAAVSARFWRPEIRMDFTVTVSWDWDRNSLDLQISTGFGQPAPASDTVISEMVVDEPVNQQTAPRVLLSRLLDRLNKRQTGTGSTIGDPKIRAGGVVQIEGVGETFGGRYRITDATHTLDASGYRTHFEVRKEVWFGSIPLQAQGAVRLQVQDS